MPDLASLEDGDLPRLEWRQLDQWFAARVAAADEFILSILTAYAEVSPYQPGRFAPAAAADLYIVDVGQVGFRLPGMRSAQSAATTLPPVLAVPLIRLTPHSAALVDADRRQ